MQTAKYSKDGPFTDPVVRCDSCHKLLNVGKLKEVGRCYCGCRRVRNVFSFDAKERQIMENEWQIDPEFLTLFEQTSE